MVILRWIAHLVFSHLSKAPLAHTVTGRRCDRLSVRNYSAEKLCCEWRRAKVSEPWQCCCQVTHNPVLLISCKCLLTNNSNFKCRQCLHAWSASSLRAKCCSQQIWPSQECKEERSAVAVFWKHLLKQPSWESNSWWRTARERNLGRRCPFGQSRCILQGSRQWQVLESRS